jgi:hypothetical protein
MLVLCWTPSVGRPLLDATTREGFTQAKPSQCMLIANSVALAELHRRGQVDLDIQRDSSLPRSLPSFGRTIFDLGLGSGPKLEPVLGPA